MEKFTPEINRRIFTLIFNEVDDIIKSASAVLLHRVKKDIWAYTNIKGPD